MELAGGGGCCEHGSDGKEEVEFLVANLEEVLGIELDVRVAGQVQNALDEAAVLTNDLKGEAPAGEVVEDAGMVAGDVHATAEAG